MLLARSNKKKKKKEISKFMFYMVRLQILKSSTKVEHFTLKEKNVKFRTFFAFICTEYIHTIVMKCILKFIHKIVS